jgi:ribosomal protein S21
VVEVKKKDGESFESLIRRFSRRTLQSGRLLQAKKIRFFQKEASDLMKKESALRRKDAKAKRDYLKRIGKLDETQERRRRF